jgi:hypothetical protein
MYLSPLDIFSKDGRGNHVLLAVVGSSIEGVQDAADHAEPPVHTHEEHGRPDDVAPRERGEVAASFFSSDIERLDFGYCIQECGLRSSIEANRAGLPKQEQHSPPLIWTR